MYSFPDMDNKTQKAEQSVPRRCLFYGKFTAVFVSELGVYVKAYGNYRHKKSCLLL